MFVHIHQRARCCLVHWRIWHAVWIEGSILGDIITCEIYMIYILCIYIYTRSMWEQFSLWTTFLVFFLFHIIMIRPITMLLGGSNKLSGPLTCHLHCVYALPPSKSVIPSDTFTLSTDVRKINVVPRWKKRKLVLKKQRIVESSPCNWVASARHLYESSHFRRFFFSFLIFPVQKAVKAVLSLAKNVLESFYFSPIPIPLLPPWTPLLTLFHVRLHFNHTGKGRGESWPWWVGDRRRCKAGCSRRTHGSGCSTLVQ